MSPDIVQAAIKKLAQEANKTARINSIAATMRFGGVYTPLGMEKANNEADLNAMDRIKAKQMIGTGGLY